MNVVQLKNKICVSQKTKKLKGKPFFYQPRKIEFKKVVFRDDK